jgi:hypothetical protein
LRGIAPKQPFVEQLLLCVWLWCTPLLDDEEDKPDAFDVFDKFDMFDIFDIFDTPAKKDFIIANRWSSNSFATNPMCMRIQNPSNID